MFVRSSFVSFARTGLVLLLSFFALEGCAATTTTASSKHEPNAPAALIAGMARADSAGVAVERGSQDRFDVDRSASRSNESRSFRIELDCRRCNR